MHSTIRTFALMFSIWLGGCQQSEVVSNRANAATPAAAKGGESSPIVVELYQSQGCSSCPPANAALNAIADRPGVIALSFAVTYWDRLGWKDIFADKSYTQRQYDYAKAMANANVYTPQIVINGKHELTGIKRGELSHAVEATRPLSGGPPISVEGRKLIVGKGSGDGDIWLVRYDPQTQQVKVRSGENGGRTLPHKNVVRSLVRVGQWHGKAVSYTLPMSASAIWKSAILVQRQAAGEIISAKII